MIENPRVAKRFMLKSQVIEAPATACDGPGVWPHLTERHDVSNASAHPIVGAA